MRLQINSFTPSNSTKTCWVAAAAAAKDEHVAGQSEEEMHALDVQAGQQMAPSLSTSATFLGNSVAVATMWMC
jgi:hypothetical protein